MTQTKRLKTRKWFVSLALILSTAGLGACNGQNPEETGGLSSKPPSGYNPAARTFKTDALIYGGTATAVGGAEVLEEIVTEMGLTSDVVSSSELNEMSLEDLKEYGTIVWPGGYATQMSNSLNESTRQKIRTAVREHGVGYVGICAGAFIAVSPSTRWGFNLMEAPTSDGTLEYYHLELSGTPHAPVNLMLRDGKTREVIWWGGPYLPELSKGVLARYEDTGEPAILQGYAGKGLIAITGPHPEAPAFWQERLGISDSDGLDHDVAAELIQASIKGHKLETVL